MAVVACAGIKITRLIPVMSKRARVEDESAPRAIPECWTGHKTAHLFLPWPRQPRDVKLVIRVKKPTPIEHIVD